MIVPLFKFLGSKSMCVGVAMTMAALRVDSIAVVVTIDVWGSWDDKHAIVLLRPMFGMASLF
jgi:hypothetical protein